MLERIKLGLQPDANLSQNEGRERLKKLRMQTDADHRDLNYSKVQLRRENENEHEELSIVAEEVSKGADVLFNKFVDKGY